MGPKIFNDKVKNYQLTQYTIDSNTFLATQTLWKISSGQFDFPILTLNGPQNFNDSPTKPSTLKRMSKEVEDIFHFTNWSTKLP